MMSDNDIPRIDALFAYVSVDAKGMEGIPAVRTEMGVMPLVCGDPRRLESMKELARSLKSSETISLSLYRFDRAECVDAVTVDGSGGKYYRGMRIDGDCSVTVNGEPLNPRQDLRNHSPTGLNWGYGGSGPAQLALAMLADCLGDDLAQSHYMAFKQEIVAQLPDVWILSDEAIRDWLLSRTAAHAAQ